MWKWRVMLDNLSESPQHMYTHTHTHTHTHVSVVRGDVDFNHTWALTSLKDKYIGEGMTVEVCNAQELCNNSHAPHHACFVRLCSMRQCSCLGTSPTKRAFCNKIQIFVRSFVVFEKSHFLPVRVFVFLNFPSIAQTCVCGVWFWAFF